MAEDASPADDVEQVGYVPGDGWSLLVAVTSGGFVAVAVAVEVLGGSFANSSVPDWADVAPTTWPGGLRSAWWTAVAAAAGACRLALHRIGLPQRPVIVAASVLPFLVFAAGIAAGADWATWH
jgi:hypothetical protein